MRPPLRLPLALCVVLLALAGCGGGGGGGGDPEPQVLWTVTNLNNAGAGSLRHAANNAPDGAWIVFDPSLATGTITLNAPIPIDRPIVIGGLSGSLERHTISGNNATRLFEVGLAGRLDLRDLVLTQGHAGNNPLDGGGAIYADGGDLLLSRVTFVSCHAPNGGGGAIRIEGGVLVMADSAVNACTAKWGGAMQATESLGHYERSSFYLNTALNTPGGALHLISGQHTLVNSSVVNNTVLGGGISGVGGGVSMISHQNHGAGQLVVWASTIANNVADAAGGIHVRVQNGEDCHLVLGYSIVADNNTPAAEDLLFVDGADAEGEENVIGVGDGSFFFNGIDHNQVGDAFTPLDPHLQAVSFISHGRAVRAPAAASPARNTVSTAQILRPNGAALLLDEQGGARVQGGAPDVGAIEQ